MTIIRNSLVPEFPRQAGEDRRSCQMVGLGKYLRRLGKGAAAAGVLLAGTALLPGSAGAAEPQGFLETVHRHTPLTSSAPENPAQNPSAPPASPPPPPHTH